MVSQDAEAQVKRRIEAFAERAVRRIHELSAKELLDENAINPLLVKALGIDDFESLAKFYVYQRLGRSVVTSFGTEIEYMVRLVAEGTKGEWWDVVKHTPDENFYMSVKSGPQDMDKDQVDHFASRAKEVMKSDPKAVPFIAMGYGKTVWPIITGTLRNNGLDPGKHAYVGKKLYQKITGESDYDQRLLQVVGSAAKGAAGGRGIIDLYEDKIAEVAAYFKSHFKSVDDLLSSLL